MQSEQPCDQEQTAYQRPGDPLHAWVVLQAIRSGGENEAHDAANRETRDMRADIRALAAEAKKDEKHDSGSKRRPTTNPATPRDHTGSPHVPGENTQRPKDAGRRADRGVFWRLNQHGLAPRAA